MELRDPERLQKLDKIIEIIIRHFSSNGIVFGPPDKGRDGSELRFQVLAMSRKIWPWNGNNIPIGEDEYVFTLRYCNNTDNSIQYKIVNQLDEDYSLSENEEDKLNVNVWLKIRLPEGKRIG